VHAALSLVLTLFGVAVLFVAQDAHFLAAVQVIVYAGAIVVLFLFVIMLLGVDRAENLQIEPIPVQRPLAVIVGGGLLGILVTAIAQARDSVRSGTGAGIDIPTASGDPDGNVRQIARSLFSDHVFAFELVSVLLVVAVVGTVLLSRRVPGAPAEAAPR
jgi:NADH-quinone oxidoreductase subunit J